MFYKAASETLFGNYMKNILVYNMKNLNPSAIDTRSTIFFLTWHKFAESQKDI